MQKIPTAQVDGISQMLCASGWKRDLTKKNQSLTHLSVKTNICSQCWYFKMAKISYHATRRHHVLRKDIFVVVVAVRHSQIYES